MKRKHNYLKLCPVLTALSLLSLADPAMAKGDVPFKGVEVGAASAGPFDFPIATILDSSEGEATHLGHYTKTGIIEINVLSGEVAGTFTLTAANGDMLFLTSTGQAPPPSVKQTVANYTITGGTGRFKGATGSWVQTSQFTFFFGETSTDPYVAVLDEGTISTPGADKK